MNNRAKKRLKIVLLDDRKDFTKACMPFVRREMPQSDIFLCDSPAKAQKVAKKFNIDFVISDLDFHGEEREMATSFLENCAKKGTRIMLCSALEKVPHEFEQAVKGAEIIFHDKLDGAEKYEQKLKELHALKPKPGETGKLFHWLTSEEFLSKYHVAPPPREANYACFGWLQQTISRTEEGTYA